MKTHSYVIWMKAVALISVLLMSTHRADLSISEVETTLQFEIATDSSQVVINPDGPLNFLRGYIYQKMECMYNKRFFSPQINTDYELKVNTDIFNLENLYIYTREEQKDEAYEALPENKMDKYAEQYHKHLIELFPSPTGDITIETRGNQSFVQFLRAKTTEEHSLKILAMLLLFSEGVIIPIDVSNKVLKVYETDKKDKIYFEVSMVIPWFNKESEKEENFQQKKVKQMINFFKEYATNQEVLSMMVDKCSQEEVVAGKFLDSPKFLIQSYIFGFIDSADCATEFIQTVHTMTEKYAPKTEAPSKDDSVYDRLFMPAGTVTGTDCAALMKKTQETLNAYRVFPFADSTQVPAYRSLPLYNRKDKLFSTDRLKDYSNCVDCMILSLFCCLAYDPAKGIYRTDHMGNISEELEEFFAPENQPFDTTKAKLQKEWCRVVADLDEPSIAYCKERNELDCGLINMLMVIAEVINAPKEEKKKILGFSQSLNDKHGKLEKDLCDAIKEYTEVLLKRLSKTENIQVEFSEFTSDNYNDERYDLSGDITITFEHSSIQNTIVIGIDPAHSTIDMKPIIMKKKDDRIEKMTKIAGICNNGSTFVENLFSTYMRYEIRKIDRPKKSEEFMRQQVRKTAENKFEDINRLLLVKKINGLKYKKELFNYSIMHATNQKLSPDHPIVRFTSNIIGSIELNNWNAQVYMIPSIVFADLHTKNGSNLNYPNIKFSEERYKLICINSNASFFIDYAFDCNMDVFVRWIKFCIDNLYTQTKTTLNPLLDPLINRRICKHIFKNGTMECANEIKSILVEKYNGGDEVLNIVHLVWVFYLCLEETPDLKLIKANINAIQEIKLFPSRFNLYVDDFFVFHQVVENLNAMKDHICEDDNDLDKFFLVINFFKGVYNPSFK
ncbi:hypothetical protein NEAUS06_0741 [Nematocida ausubeli]|nr:hypothetical protein NEAUS06_0741 [Nematocida ausubeli]